MADIGYWLVTIPVRVVLGVVLAVITLVVIVVVAFIVFVCATNFTAWWRRSPRTRLFRLGLLGGVTTLTRSLGYNCTMCRDSMEAGEEVRTLSCGHVFHCGGTEKCGLGIDAWLLAGDPMFWQSCPVCRRVPHPVLPWRRTPPAPSSPQTSDSEEEELLFPSHWFDETLPE